MTPEPILKNTFTLTAGETDAKGLMPVRLMASRAIEAATLHSNRLGIGFADLKPLGIGWVLARLSIEVDRYPEINEEYSVATWIQSVNPKFSDRAILISDKDSNPVARIHTVWVAIDIEKRVLANLTPVGLERFPVVSDSLNVEHLPAPSFKDGAELTAEPCRFYYSDIDFNGHVNALNYISAALNVHGPEFYASRRITRLDAVYEHECRYGDRAEVVFGPDKSVDGAETYRIVSETKRFATLRLKFDK